MQNRIVIVGGNAAGVSAASAARKRDRKANITLITEESYPPYSRCGLPYVIAGDISRFEDLLIFPHSYFQMMKFNLLTQTTVKHINPNEKHIIIENTDGKTVTISYDKLILATGAKPFVPPIKGIKKREVYTLRTIEDGRLISRQVVAGKHAVIIGAGFVGLELAHALSIRGVKTLIVEMVPQILPTLLDQDMAMKARGRIEEKGVMIITGKAVDEINGREKVKEVIVGEESYDADLVIVATGVRSRTELAIQAGLTIGSTKGISVNQKMETTIPDIYAAGDCVESKNIITDQPTLCQLGTIALRQGKVAGINAAGGQAIFKGVLCSAVLKAFDLEIGATGLTSNNAEKNGIKTVSGRVRGKTRAEYFPGTSEINVKIISDTSSSRVIGSQIIGSEGVAQRINMLALGIQKQVKLEELVQIDACYSPPVADSLEVVMLSAEMALQKQLRKSN
jgi:NADH oxidase (H2O2-forming)